MKTLKIKFFAATLLSASIFLSSCQKEKLPEVTDSTAEITSIDDVYRETMEAGTETKNHKSLGCKVVTQDTAHGRIIIDFGSGCVDGHGGTRSGQIVILYNSPNFLQSGNIIKVSFNNYRQNANQLAGWAEYRNNGFNTNGNIEMKCISNIIITAGNGIVTTLNTNQTYELLAGSNTTTKEDDQFSVTGTTTGSLSNGSHLEYYILQPLVKNRTTGCNQFYVQGQTKTRKTGQPEKYLDYGNGTCDNLAEETVNGLTRIITLN
ncbi:MAG: hypothetical protein U0T74_05505 [Chitinophagales bacterium]